jgi:hypothetical protein
MSFYDLNSESISDSKSFTKSIVRNIVPKGGKAVVGTSQSQRGFADQTMTSVDLISAASGSELFKNNVYENMFRRDIIRENLNSLSTTIFEGQVPDKEGDPGGWAGAVLTQSGLGLEGNRGLIEGLNSGLRTNLQNAQSDISSVDGNSHTSDDYESSDGSPGSTGSPSPTVALISKLNSDQLSYYSQRGRLLASKLRVSASDQVILKNGFSFDIKDDNINAEFYSVGSDTSGGKIPLDLISAPRQMAFISANLTECLLALVSPSYGPALTINGSFGIGRTI